MRKIKFLSLVLSLIFIFAAFSGCAESKTAYWDTSDPWMTYEDGSIRENYVQVNFSPEDQYEVWVNVSDLETDNSVLGVAAGFSTTVNSKKSTITLTKDILTATDGWVRVLTGISTSYAYVDVYTKYKMHVNEIIICSVEKGEVYECTFRVAGCRISQSETSNRHEFTEEELAEMKHSPKCVCDEQDMTFDRAKILAAFEAAVPSSGSASASK